MASQEKEYLKIDYFIFGILGVLSFAIAAIVTARIGNETGGSLSIQRTALLAGLSLLAVLSGFIAVYSIKNTEKLNLFIKKLNPTARSIFAIFLVILGILGWLTFIRSDDYYILSSAFFNRIRPTILAVGFVAAEAIFISLNRFKKKEITGVIKRNIDKKTFFITLAIAFFLLFFTSTTKFGVLSDLGLWNVVGIPVSSLQTFFVVISFFLLFLLTRNLDFSKKRPLFVFILPIAVYMTAVLLWGLTPLESHFFSYLPTTPNYQPYPHSDARVHDLGAVSILLGKGIYFHGFTDKPLYMVILAIFHSIVGNNYSAIQWMQVLLLGLIPVFGYLLGKEFFNPIFGLFVSTFILLEQRNSIVLSRMISSANVKLLVTEGITLLGITALTYLLYRWSIKKSKNLALLLGGLIGAISLIRLNPILFLPAIILVIFIVFWKLKRKLLVQSLLLICGFLIVFLPWIFTGTNTDGTPWFLLKIDFVINERISAFDPPIETNDTINTQQKAGTALLKMDPSKINEIQESGFFEGTKDVIVNFSSHFLHNIVTSFIALPGPFTTENIASTVDREFWQDNEKWDGVLYSDEKISLLINVFLVILGISFGWKMNQWKGFIPLFVFVIYDLALTVSMTSGGRYIVPINWILYFYYALGIVFLFEILFTIAGKKEISKKPEFITGSQPSHSVLPVLILLVLVALPIPAANILLPKLITPYTLPDAGSVLAENGIPLDTGIEYVSGLVLYPYHDREFSTLQFDLLRNDQTQSYTLSKGFVIKNAPWLEDEEPILVGFTEDGQVDSIYTYRNGVPEKFWSLPE